MTQKKPPNKKQKTGRKPEFKEAYIHIAENLCLLGGIDEDLAATFEVSVTTIKNWKAKYPAFLTAITRAKEQADGEIARSVYQRAKGFEWEEEVAIKYRTGQGMEEAVKVVKVKKIVPPDTNAGIFWLTNRQRKNWKQKPLPSKPQSPLNAPPKKISFAMDRDIKNEEKLS